MIWKWAGVLRRRTMRCDYIDKKLFEWCVRSSDEIWRVHQIMRNGLRVADEVNIKRVSLALKHFLFFSPYYLSCIGK